MLPKAGIQISRKAAYTGHTGSVFSLIRDVRNPGVFYSAGGDQRIIQWDTRKPSTGSRIGVGSGTIFALLSLPGEQLAIGQMNGILSLFTPGSENLKTLLPATGYSIFDLLCYDNRMIAAHGNGRLTIWNLEDEALLQTIQLSDKSIRQMSLHPEGRLLAAGVSDNTIYLIETENYTVVRKLNGHQNSVFAVCFSPDGNYLLSGSRDAQVKIWDARNNYTLVHSIPAHMFTVNSIACSPDGRYFATGSRDHSIRIWDAQSFALLKVIDREKYVGHTHSVNRILWLEEDNLLISTGDDRKIMVWEIKTAREELE
ncbi:MAG: hypothetical protein KatS3mg031_0444 [Chitinophagales bacterium]|nr:MAG: hypothetical protein KatS3mg031_0444 [Chitinophagales bacterium]